MSQQDPNEEGRRYNPEGDYLEYLKQNHTASSEAENNAIKRAQQKNSTNKKKKKSQRRAQLAPGTEKRSVKQALQVVFKGRRKLSPIVLVLALLFGGGGIFSAILAPGTTLLALADILQRDLNTQLSAVDKTSAQMWRTKLKQTTSGSCGKVVLRCKFTTVNMKQVNKAVQRVNSSSPDTFKITYDEDAGFGKGRGRIASITLVQEDGTKFEAKTAEDFTRLMKEQPAFREKMFFIYNPRFTPFKSTAAIRFLSKAKTSYAKKLKGNNSKEVASSMDQAVRGETSIDVKKLTPLRDEEGRLTGEYGDPETGAVYTQAEAEGLLEQERRLESVPSSSRLLGGLARGTLITSWADTACTVYNTSRAVSVAAKTIRARELIRYAMVFINEAHAIRAEMATPATVQYASNIVMEQVPDTKVSDMSKLASTPAGQALPEVQNPNAGKTGMDSELLGISRSQDYPKRLGVSTQRLLLGSGTANAIDDVNKSLARTLGAKNARELSQRCKVIQNPVVRGGSLVIGIAAGVGSFGATTALSIAGSTALAFALPYLTSQLAEMAAGTVTEGLEGPDAVSAVAIGADAMYNGMAREQGMITMNPEDMTDYQNSKREALVAYDELDKLAAARDPFDITNQFSFAGSLARTTLPIATAMHNGGTATLSSLSMIASQAASAVLPLVGADDGRQTLVKKDRYTYCNDPDYAELGPNVAINPTCVMVFGLPQEAMDIDPMENLEWMLAHDELIEGSDSGDPKDNGRDWNYKKFLEQCVDQQPGASEDIEADPTNGANCTSEKNYEKNWHYAKFKLSLGINEGIDQDSPGLTGGSEQGFASGSDGPVGEDGWAYPTDRDKTEFTSGFGMRGGDMHNGVDLAGPVGTPLYAARDGKVIAAGTATGFGHWIVLRHEDTDGSRVDTVYGHMYPDGVFVSTGDEVKAGQNIAAMGNAGWSSGPHLHFEVWKGGYPDLEGGSGRAVDPQPYLDVALRGAEG